MLDPAVTSARVLHPSTRKGGTLRVLADSDCDYWDPQRTYYGNCWSQLRWFSRQLLTYTRAPMSTELVGDLATAPARSTDRRTWTYTLREGIRFEDGTPITSRDIKYAVERVFATDVVSGGPTYVIDYLQTNPPYGGPYTDTSPEKLGLTSVETPDDRTIVFHLNKPFGDWNRVMAMPTTTPVPRARDTAARYTDHPVSSGPYKIESYEVGKKLVLVRNDQWNPATDPVNKALPDRIEETMGLDLDAIDSRILAGDGDVVAAQNGVQEAARARLVADPTLRSSRTSLDHNGFLRYLSVTMTVKPFDNIHCRKAVAWAVDRQAQIEARGGSTAGDVATTMLPPTLRYYQPFDLYPSTDGRGSVAKAREELAACGHPDGFATTLVTQDAAKYKAQADALTASLKRVGISVTVKAFPADRYYSAELGVPATMQRNGYGLAIAVWGSDWPSASGFLGPIVDGRKIFPAGNSNYAELDSKTVNDGIDAGLAASDDGVAQRAWTAVDRAVVDSAAYIPLIYDKAFNVYSDRVTNIVYSPAYNVIDFASLGVTG
ncbi:peptide-binding protein [Pseudofrankia sp. BMG5.36]|nr:peptide-binding protein [Pseudofrankia sp. BMG5.36]